MEKKFRVIDFQKEKKKFYFIGLTIVLFVVLALSYIVNDLFLSILVGFLIGGVYFIRVYQWNKYYIESISISDGTIVLFYYKNEKLLSIQTDLGNVKIKKKLAIVSAGREPVMKISNNQGLNIHQYEIGDWSEEIMDEVILKVNSYN